MTEFNPSRSDRIRFVTATAPDRPVSTGFKVDPFRGERIGRVSSEWFSRPDDERFLSLGALHDAVRARADRANAANAPGRSLFVRLRGPESGQGACGNWQDPATGEFGDLLDIIRLSRGLVRMVDAMDEARLFLSLPRSAPPQPLSAPHASPEAARRLFAMGQPITGTLAEAYLRQRGITTDLRDLPLRFHFACYVQTGAHDGRQSRPALLAAVTDGGGAITGVHRTWLDPAQATKAQVSVPRKAMGHLLGNGVRFSVTRDVMAVGEGLETMLSLRTALPAMPMIAALSAGHLAALRVPTGLRRLYVVRDNDRAGRHAVRRLRDRDDLRGIDLCVLKPTLNDLNDDLRVQGPEAVIDALRRQLAPDDLARFLPIDAGTR